MTVTATQKFLVIRFSSIGDVTQCLSVPAALKARFPDAEIHWITREDLVPLLQNHPAISKVWGFPRKAGLLGLWDISKELSAQEYSLVYDAHNNLRSRALSFFLWYRSPLTISVLRRSIFRLKRFFLFQLRVNLFEKPFNGQKDLLRPLFKLGVAEKAPPAPQMFLTDSEISEIQKNHPELSEKFVALAPSAAYELKRWPLQHFKDLVMKLPQTRFVVLGGPEDKFTEEISALDPSRILNLSGKLSLRQSAAAVKLAQALVANDTGVLHFGEQLGVKTVALMGPAPFGFPSRPDTEILQRDLPCRPCSKHGQGPCVNPNFQECLRSITADEVASVLKRWIL